MNIEDLYQLYLQHPCITTDSRNCPKDSIFLALKGESFDGNKFAQGALDKGCAYAIVDNPQYADPNQPKIILVNDCLLTYKALARMHRRQFNIPIIGITGTNGKTTTKELLSAVLSEKFNVMHTEGNYNNDVGVPKTLFRLNDNHEIAVVEMGASHIGDIKKLVDYVEPTCGLITNVGRAHLQGFGSFEGIKQTKGELYDYLKAHDGLLFLNESNPDLVEMANERQFNRIVSYGQSDDVNVCGTLISCNPFVNFSWTDLSTPHTKLRTYEVTTHLIGAYNIDNLLASIAVGLHFGVTPEQINHALSHYIPSNNRSQLEETAHNKLIVDAYNANPSSMKAAIENFKWMDVPHKMAILGDMLELGEVSASEHQKVVDMLQSDGFDKVWLVGKEFEKTHTTYRKFKDVDEVKAAIAAQQPQNHSILIKGSNSIRLFELPPYL